MDQSIIDSYSTFNEFSPHFWFLAMLGYMKIVHENVTDRTKFVQNIYRVIVVFIIFTYNIQHIIFVYQQRDNSDLLIDSLFMLLTTLVTFSKHLVFNFSSGIDVIVEFIRDPKFLPSHDEHVKMMKENASKMYKMLIAFVMAVETSCIFYPVYHYMNRHKFGITSYFPFDSSQSPIFEVTIIYLAVILSVIGSGNAAMDITLVSFYSQAKIQIRILRFNLEHLTDFDESTKIASQDINTGRNDYFYDIADEAYRNLVQSRVIKCVEHYKHITRFLIKVESVFREAMTVQLLVCSWVNCITAYKAVGLSVMSAEFMSMFVYLSCIVFELYINCYYGAQVEDESQFVNQSLYFCEWSRLSPSFRKQLIIMTYCFCRPLTPKVAYVVPLSLNTFVSVLRASYTLFTILRS